MAPMNRFLSTLTAGLVCLAFLPTVAQGAFGVNGFDSVFSQADGTSANGAGLHPFAFTIGLNLNADEDGPEGRLRKLVIEGIPGLAVNTLAYPRCLNDSFIEVNEGHSNCPLETAVGIGAGSYEEPGKWTTTPIYNLEPAPGALLSLGLRLANTTNLVIDVGLNPDPPYNLVAVVRDDIPEATELFGLELQLWGDPAAVAHDGLRGACGVYTTTLVSGDVADFEFESQDLSCAVQRTPFSFLTSPTDCKGPLESRYEVFSWADEWDAGFSLTHDRAGDPVGLTGCGQLGFDPMATVEPTTTSAQSPTGLDLSIDVHDEGLRLVGGFAQSDIEEVALLLPEGMSAGPLLTSGAGACSEADFAEERPDAAPEDGCPTASAVGSVTVESQLVDEPVDGVVYRAAPFENLAEDAPMALYLVLENQDLGIFLKQPVALETDPETGGLIAAARDLPQLPFSHLLLHLPETATGPLIAPPRCGGYEALTEFAPWSGGPPFLTSSSFSLVTGPSGGPCPTGRSGDQASQLPVSPSPSAVPIHLPGIAPKRRCPKGKHRVRRKGRVRCVKKRRRRAPEHRRSSRQASYP
jgi:hypothetical protein